MATGAYGEAHRSGMGLRRAFAWWTGELAGMLAVRDRGPTMRIKKALLLLVAGNRLEFLWRDGSRDVEAGGIDWQSANELSDVQRTSAQDTVASTPFGRLRPKNRHVGIKLGADAVLVRDMTFPQAVEDDLREVLMNRMDRITPYGAEQVFFGHTIMSRNAAERTINVRISVVPRSRIADLLDAAAAMDLDVSFLSVPGSDRDFVIDLRAVPTVPIRRGFSKGVTAVLVVANLVLAGAVIGLPLFDKFSRDADLRERVETAKLKADLVYKLRERIAELKAEVLFLPNSKNASVLSIAVLDELTRVLPDDTWLEKLILADGAVQIFGQSPAAPSLIGRIEVSEQFHDVRFSASVTKVQGNNMDRFHITAALGAGN